MRAETFAEEESDGFDRDSDTLDSAPFSSYAPLPVGTVSHRMNVIVENISLLPSPTTVREVVYDECPRKICIDIGTASAVEAPRLDRTRKIGKINRLFRKV